MEDKIINTNQIDGVQVEESPEVKQKSGFSSKLGFVLAAAGSAVGLGNLWRFPYLAAKYGGALFLICYILLAITIGFTLLVLEISIGRKTGKGVIGAFKELNRKFKWFGYICVIVPLIIVPYYCVIGGWVIKYMLVFLTGQGKNAADSAYFGGFVGTTYAPLVTFLIFSTV